MGWHCTALLLSSTAGSRGVGQLLDTSNKVDYLGLTKNIVVSTLSEQMAHSIVDLHLKEISEYHHGSVMKKNFTL